MAKTSAIQKNLKRIKLVKKYANRRAALKKIIKIVKQNEKDIHKKDFVKKIKIDNQDLIG